MFCHLHCHILLTIRSQKIEIFVIKHQTLNYVSNSRPIETAAQRRSQPDDSVSLYANFYCSFTVKI